MKVSAAKKLYFVPGCGSRDMTLKQFAPREAVRHG